jgi:tetratricopeptide (TPR) repeat protein
MNQNLTQSSNAARNAAHRKDWATVNGCAKEILKLDRQSPEGYFLGGLVAKASGKPEEATEAFAKALQLGADRYDAAIELANQHCAARRNADAYALVIKYEDKMSNSPLYLNMAGAVYSGIGMPEKAWPLYNKANELQPGVNLIESNIAICSVFLGKIEEAKQMFRRLLEQFPTHQRYHYQLAELEKATDKTHIEQMQEALRSMNMTPDKNIFMYYAIGKEFEDLEEWEEAFKYFKMAGDAVTNVANYDINTDLQLIDKIIEVCNEDWLRDGAIEATSNLAEKTPIFVVGLPRTGTTLTERIIVSHSQVSGAGETQFMQMVTRRESGVTSDEKMTPAMIEAAVKLDIKVIGDGYMDMVNYKLGDEPMFVDKLPFNIFYLGFIAKAFPNARIIHVKRNPMDSCFAMYKKVFTWAYKFSYTLEGLGLFYPAYFRLLNHWREMFGERIIEVEYEKLVTDQEGQTRMLLEKLDLDFEEACLNFEQSSTATITASAVQVREKIHTRSVNRWKNYEPQLQSLKECLETAGITVE